MPTGALTSHFTWAEVTRSPTARRLGINNELPPELEQWARFTAAQMEQVRQLIGVPIRVNSWYRSPDLNRAVGGSATSQHRYGMAVDWEPIPESLLSRAFEAVAASDIPFDQLIHEGTKDGANWIHLGFSKLGIPRRQVLLGWGTTLGGAMTFTRVLKA